MATSGEILTMLLPKGGWVAVGHDWEGVSFLECEPITKEQFDLGASQYDAWKAQQDADKAAAKQVLLNKLGITAEEAQLLLGGN